MRVERLELTNFRGIRHLVLEFPTQITVLVGVNGAGKSAILDALGMLLSEWVDMLHPHRGDEPARMSPKDVLNGEKENRIVLSVQDEEQHGYQWGLSGPSTVMAWLARDPDDLSGLRQHMEKLKKRIREGNQDSLPLIAYYSTDRGMWSSEWDDEEERAPEDEVLAAYKGALPAELGDFGEFTRWFRAREDLENERRARERQDFEEPQLKGVRNAVETTSSRTPIATRSAGHACAQDTSSLRGPSRYVCWVCDNPWERAAAPGWQPRTGGLLGESARNHANPEDARG